MADKFAPREAVTVREMLLSQMFERGALLDLLERKSVLTKQEFLDEVKALQRKAAKGSAPDIDDQVQWAGWMGAVENQRDHPLGGREKTCHAYVPPAVCRDVMLFPNEFP